MTGETIDVQVVILPLTKFQKELIALSRRLSESYRSLFTLSEKINRPHLTLYQSVYPRRRFDSLCFETVKIVSHYRPFKVELERFSSFNKAIFYDVVKNNNLLKLHSELVEKINPLRENLITKECQDLLRNDNLSSNQRENIIKYGNPLVFEEYRPHFTLTALADEDQVQETLSFLENEKQGGSFMARTVAITYPGPYRTCREIVEKINLCKS